ncbi:hypothetical protein EI77_02565 [Prosthecobacter fusiformis]|uniref:Uncharacterized protein n=1 Tax=Prosthecobacter fusiformis TaxID=48464 RepID=A0A4R7RZX8_9BACT|nr:hypothetical protein [Prosthecobacter fusiformis]TDU71441.1 hypothetical protein EI77_02565 [Prosthecobacter fusiformis]
MTLLTRLALATAGALLASCASKKVSLSDDPLAFPIAEEEPAYIPTYSKSALAGWPKGRAMDPYDKSRVRLDEEVHAYHVGRLPSRDRQEMHEAHTVYRVEQHARWDTRLPATPMESRGVVLGIVEPSRNEVPKNALIEQERQSLMAKTQSLQITMTKLNSLQRDLEKKRSEFDDAEKESKEIQLYLAKTIQERDQVSEQLKKANERIVELEDNERLRVRGSSSQGINSGKK